MYNIFSCAYQAFMVCESHRSFQGFRSDMFIVQDFSLSLVPTLVIWRLNMEDRRKISIISAMSLRFM